MQEILFSTLTLAVVWAFFPPASLYREEDLLPPQHPLLPVKFKLEPSLKYPKALFPCLILSA